VAQNNEGLGLGDVVSSVGAVPSELSDAFRRRVIIAQSLYALGAVVGLLDITLGIAVIILVQLNYAIAPRLPTLSRLRGSERGRMVMSAQASQLLPRCLLR
jgi:hypothetical protein